MVSFLTQERFGFRFLLGESSSEGVSEYSDSEVEFTVFDIDLTFDIKRFDTVRLVAPLAIGFLTVIFRSIHSEELGRESSPSFLRMEITRPR